MSRPLAKFAETAAFISTLDCGFATAVALYNMLAISKLSYIAAFCRPTKHVHRVERWALQKITCGPFNAIPCGALHSLKAIGLPFQALKVDDISFAAGVRSANITSQHFGDKQAAQTLNTNTGAKQQTQIDVKYTGRTKHRTNEQLKIPP